MQSESRLILLIGADAALLEGIAQSVAALGYTPRVLSQLRDVRELDPDRRPLVAVVHNSLAAASAAIHSLQLAAGGALVLYRTVTDGTSVVDPTVQRAVLANLILPLERQRLMALVQRVSQRAKATGRSRGEPPSETTAR